MIARFTFFSYITLQMKARKILLFLLLPLIAETVISCCHCLEPVLKRYTNKTLLIDNLDNSNNEPVISTSGSVAKTAYGIRIHLSREKIACINRSRSVFIQSAFAYKCDCPPPNQFLPEDSITSIKVFTVNDFDATHSANSDISDYFKVYTAYLFTFTTIPDYLRNTSPVLYSENELEVKLDLLLMTPPSFNNQHRFRVQITLSDGRVLQQETSEIQLV